MVSRADLISFVLLIVLPVLLISVVFITNALIEEEYRKTHPYFGSGYTAMKFYFELLIKWCKRTTGVLIITIMIMARNRPMHEIQRLGINIYIHHLLLDDLIVYLSIFVHLLVLGLWIGYFISLIDFLRKKSHFFNSN